MSHMIGKDWHKQRKKRRLIMIRTPLMIIGLIFFVSVTQSDAYKTLKCKQNIEKQNPIHSCKDTQCEDQLNDELREAEKRLRRESHKFEKLIYSAQIN